MVRPFRSMLALACSRPVASPQPSRPPDLDALVLPFSVRPDLVVGGELTYVHGGVRGSLTLDAAGASAWQSELTCPLAHDETLDVPDPSGATTWRERRCWEDRVPGPAGEPPNAWSVSVPVVGAGSPGAGPERGEVTSTLVTVRVQWTTRHGLAPCPI